MIIIALVVVWVEGEGREGEMIFPGRGEWQ